MAITERSLTTLEPIDDIVRAHRRYAATHDEDLRAALLKHYDFVALAVASRFRSRGEPLEDLQQVGRAAMVAALERYDPERGVSFSTYAWRVISGEIKRYFRDHGWHVHVPRTLQENFLDVARAADELTARLGHPATVGELSTETGLAPERVAEALAARGAREADSLDATHDGARTVGDVGVNERGFDRIEEVCLVDDLVRRLPPPDRDILRMRYAEDLTQAEIGDRMGCSQMQVSRRLASLHARMRAWVRIAS